MSSEWTIYLDGADVTVARSQVDTADTTDRLWLGADPATGGYFIGSLAEFAVYDYVLSDAQVAAHSGAADWAAYAALMAVDQPGGWWHLSEEGAEYPATAAMGPVDGHYSSGCTFAEAGPFVASSVGVDDGEGVLFPDCRTLRFGNYAQSWEVWLKRSETADDARLLFGKGTGSLVGWISADLVIGSGLASVSGAVASTAIDDTDWHHIVITKSGDARPDDTPEIIAADSAAARAAMVGVETPIAAEADLLVTYAGKSLPTDAETAQALRCLIKLAKIGVGQ